MGRHDPDRVIMVGTSPSTRGGIASVVRSSHHVPYRSSASAPVSAWDSAITVSETA